MQVPENSLKNTYKKVQRYCMGRERWITLSSQRTEQLDPTTLECFPGAEFGRLENPGPNSNGQRAGRAIGISADRASTLSGCHGSLVLFLFMLKSR